MNSPFPTPLGKNVQRGFTMIELIVSIAVLAVLAAIATPSFQRMIEAQRLRSTAFGLVSDLTLARSEAVKRGTAVELVPVVADDGWAGGWLIRIVSTSETVGRQNKAGSGISLTSAATAIQFNRNGQVATTTSIRMALSDSHNGRRCVTLDPSGRPKSTKAACPS